MLFGIKNGQKPNRLYLISITKTIIAETNHRQTQGRIGKASSVCGIVQDGTQTKIVKTIVVSNKTYIITGGKAIKAIIEVGREC